MPHAIIKTTKSIEDIQSMGLFRSKQHAILPIDKPFGFFIDIYKKDCDTLIVKLNKTTRIPITDSVKKIIHNTAQKIATQLNADIILNNLNVTGVEFIDCGCEQKLDQINKVAYYPNIKSNLEIGFGRGEFLLKKSQENKNEMFYGIEIFGKDFLHVLKNCCDSKIKNLKLVNYDARFAIDIYRNNFFDNICINFPEPWFKFYRIKHSIFNKITFKKIVNKIKLGGLLNIITDNYPLALSAVTLAQTEGLKPIDKYFLQIEKRFNTLYARKWEKYERIFYKCKLKKNHISAEDSLQDLKFPIKINKNYYFDGNLLFKIITVYKNEVDSKKIIEVAIGNYLTQHIFFSFDNYYLDTIPQTRFIINSEFVQIIGKLNG